MQPRLADLVGRAMIDPEFLEELRKGPQTVLAQYDLTDEERTVVTHALRRLAKATTQQQIDDLKIDLLRRVAT